MMTRSSSSPSGSADVVALAVASAWTSHAGGVAAIAVAGKAPKANRPIIGPGKKRRMLTSEGEKRSWSRSEKG